MLVKVLNYFMRKYIYQINYDLNAIVIFFHVTICGNCFGYHSEKNVQR